MVIWEKNEAEASYSKISVFMAYIEESFIFIHQSFALYQFFSFRPIVLLKK